MVRRPGIIFLPLLVYLSSSFVSAEPKIVSYTGKASTVQYVTAVFHHGETTVDAATVYPKDPYINETYYPYGVGQLTARGKEREYALGAELRKRYDALLGNVYTPDILEPISTDMNRTKASLSLVLAGLYPPKGNIMEWSSKLNWQPIPYNYLDYENDVWLTISIYFCPNYAKEYISYLNSPEGAKLQTKYASLFEYLRDNTGLNIKRPIETFFVYSCLESQTEWGLNLPEWTEKIWPEKMTEATKDGLASSVATTKLKQLSGGLLLKRIISNMKAKANNTIDPEIRKMSLYSGHELNVVYLLGALNVYTPNIVPHGACVLVELHKITDEYYVKVLYEDYTADEPKALTIPGCEEVCPLSKFESLLKANYPEKDNPCGDDVKVFEDNSQQRDFYRGKLRYKSVIVRYIEWVRDTSFKVTKAVIGTGIGIIEKTKEHVENQLNIFGKVPNIFEKAGQRFKV